jgi:hypothetical protein
MIQFLIGLALVGGIVAMMGSIPAFRNFVVVLLALVGIGILLMLFNSGRDEKATRPGGVAYASLPIEVSPSEVSLESVNLNDWRPGEYTFEGTVTNNSKSMLSTLSFDVIITDCKGDTCRIVGQSTPKIRVDVPAGQTRSFSVSGITFNGMPDPTGWRRSWKYSLTSILAQ